MCERVVKQILGKRNAKASCAFHTSFLIYPNNKYHPTPVDLIVGIVLPVLFLCIIIGCAVYYSITMNKVSTVKPAVTVTFI